MKLKFKSDQFIANKRLLESKIFDNLQNQIWSLLPGFCSFPTDFNESFQLIAKTLADLLDKRTDLRNYILQSLRNLILHTSNEADRATMSKYAKNYLPVMFNIYTTEMSFDKDPQRHSLHDTIKCYLTIADADLANIYLSKAIQNYTFKLKGEGEEGGDSKVENKAKLFDFNQIKKSKKTSNDYFTLHGLLDLVVLFVKYCNNETNANQTYDLALNGIESSDKTIQKKSYKVLDAILTNEMNEPTMAQLIKNKFESLSHLIIKSLTNCNSAAKVPRLRCLLKLLDFIDNENQKTTFIRQILPEIILCIKEVNHKSRDLSFLILNKMTSVWQKDFKDTQQQKSESDCLVDFFHLVMIGMAGSQNMISCTCLALAGLAFEYRENISGPLIDELFQTACLLSKSQQKEVICSSLNLIKVLTTIFVQTTLTQHLDSILSVIRSLHVKQESNNKTSADIAVTKSQRIRSSIKIILKKLMKKFSYEIVLDKLLINYDTNNGQQHLTTFVRHSLENLLTNLKKLIEKEKRRKVANEQNKRNKDSDNNNNNNNNNDDIMSVKSAKFSVHNNEIEDLLKESDDEDIDDEDDNKSKRTNKTIKRETKLRNKNDNKNSMTWLQENETDDPLDLLDPMAIKRVLATRPLTQNQIIAKREKELKDKQTNRGFRVDNRGRLLINDDDDEEYDDVATVYNRNKTKGYRKNRSNDNGDDDDDHIDEMMDTMSLSKSEIAKKKKKYKFEEADSDEEAMREETKSKFSYKAGGSGIHRTVKRTPEIGSEYKAKVIFFHL
jgi:ribosomal RNA-processing protein 12